MPLDYLAASSIDTWTVNDRACGALPSFLSSLPIIGANDINFHPWRFDNTPLNPSSGPASVTLSQQLWVTRPASLVGEVEYPDVVAGNFSGVHHREDQFGSVQNSFRFDHVVNRIQVTSPLGTWSIDWDPGHVIVSTTTSIIGNNSQVSNPALWDFSYTGSGPIGQSCDVTRSTQRTVLGQPVMFGEIHQVANGSRFVGGHRTDWGFVTLDTSGGSGSIHIVGPGNGGAAFARALSSYQEAWAYHLKARLVDLDGNDEHRRVIVQKAYPGVNTPTAGLNEADFYEALTTPLDIAMSRPRNIFNRAYQCGGVDDFGNQTPLVQLDLVPFVPDPRFVGIRIPTSTLQETEIGFSSLIDEWHNGCSIDAYQSNGTGFIYKSMPFDFVFTPSPSLNLTDLPIGRISLPSSKAINTSTWTAIGSGASASGQTLTAGTAGGTFQTSGAPVLSGTGPGYFPYRYLKISYSATKATNVTLELVATGNQARKYSFTAAAGNHEAWIDLSDPDVIKSNAFGQFTRATMPLIEGDASLPGHEDGTRSLGRFDGWGQGPSQLKLFFVDSAISIIAIAPTVKSRARVRQGSTYLPLSVNDNSFAANANFYGDLDSIVRFRVIQPSISAPNGWLGAGVTYQNIAQDTQFGFKLDSPPFVLWLNKDLQRYPNIDLLAGGTVYGSYNNVMTGITTGLSLLGGFEEPVQLTGQMVWGFRAAATAVPTKETPVALEWIDGTHQVVFNTSDEGMGAAQHHSYLSTLRPFRWHSEAPSSPVSFGTTTFYRHLQLYAQKHRAPVQHWKFPNTLNWGSVIWAGFQKPASDGLGITIANGRVGYWIAWVDQDTGKLWITRAWHGEGELDYVGLVDDSPDCAEPRLAWDFRTQAVTLVYARGDGIYRRYSLDFGSSWIGDPDLGAPYMAGITHAREKFNPRTQERVLVYRSADGSALADIFDGLDNFVRTVEVAPDPIDDTSFDLEWLQGYSAFDAVFIQNGERVRYRTLDDGRSWYSEPLT